MEGRESDVIIRFLVGYFFFSWFLLRKIKTTLSVYNTSNLLKIIFANVD